ncbi:hypothetical protein HPB50_005237 [Hyalomma asiaticum]|uniref:Uncharacterized protein n=1 Tax=Hyalomma asiaticum TaxID=266040 RepID=A0ACB7SI98_HYAAI|nr:hypothetical protein HPB50_005237 [Hyalomma asiaticum]
MHRTNSLRRGERYTWDRGSRARSSNNKNEQAATPRETQVRTAPTSITRSPSVLIRPIRLLLDTASQRTYTRQDLSKQIHLSCTGNEDIDVFTFGGCSKPRHYEYRKVNVTLSDRSDSIDLAPEALEVPEVSTVNTNAHRLLEALSVSSHERKYNRRSKVSRRNTARRQEANTQIRTAVPPEQETPDKLDSSLSYSKLLEELAAMKEPTPLRQPTDANDNVDRVLGSLKGGGKEGKDLHFAQPKGDEHAPVNSGSGKTETTHVPAIEGTDRNVQDHRLPTTTSPELDGPPRTGIISSTPPLFPKWSLEHYVGIEPVRDPIEPAIKGDTKTSRLTVHTVDVANAAPNDLTSSDTARKLERRGGDDAQVLHEIGCVRFVTVIAADNSSPSGQIRNTYEPRNDAWESPRSNKSQGLLMVI